MIKRQTAYKLWIVNILNSPFVRKDGEFEPNYLDFDKKQISRVNLIGIVVDKYSNTENTYATIALDDGSATIRIKAFKDDLFLLTNLKRGDMICIIGRLKEYNNEVYVIPEIVKNVDDPNLELLRKAELLKLYGKPSFEVKKVEIKQVFDQEKEDDFEEEDIEDVSENSKQKILNLIEKGPENGININEVVTNSALNEDEANLIIKELLKQGEIYQPRPGYLSIL